MSSTKKPEVAQVGNVTMIRFESREDAIAYAEAVTNRAALLISMNVSHAAGLWGTPN